MAQRESYSVATKTTEHILEKDSAVYKIPNFQRKYAWTVKEVGELLYDLFDDVNWNIEDFVNEPPYFLGAIVVVSKDDQIESVLDGQQRLTTISLMIAILQQKLRDIDYDQSRIANYNDFLWLTSRIRRSESQIRIQLHPDDETIYKKIINKPTLDVISRHKDSKIGVAAERILKDIQNEYLKSAQNKGVSDEDAIIYMLEKVIIHISFVKIIAPSESDAFRLFETLNDRGLALSAADLIKNKLLSRCSESDKRNAVDEVVGIWTEVLELVGEEEITNFLRYFWIAFHGKASKRLLYNDFEKHLSGLSAGKAMQFAKDILDAAKHYSEFANPTTVSKPIWGRDVNSYLQRLDIYNAKIVRSLLLSCAKHRKKDMLLVAKACEALTIRHSIISGKRSNELEKAYATTALKLRDSELDTWTLLNEQLTPYAQTDHQVQENFVLYSAERVSKKWRTILIRLNDHISTGETSINDSSEVEIEHILPQKPSRRIIKELGLSEETLSEHARRIGNLTLLSEKLNKRASNSPFSEKKRDLCKSEIALNKKICQWETSTWGVEEIEARSKLLAEHATRVWQWPPEKTEAKK